MQQSMNPQAGAAHPEAPQVHSVPHRSPFGALLTRTLPDYSGKYHVGVCDVEVPVSRRTFGTFRHKALANSGSAGLVMDTVMFSMFYPGEKPAVSLPVMWFPNLRQTIDGFLKMAKRTPNTWYRMAAYPVAAAAIWGTTFPATKETPMLHPPPSAEGRPGKWPLMIFSHGVGCSRLMYSAFCGEMASRGYIVCCLEHRDGTSPSSRITAEDGKTKVLDWLEWSDLEWPDLETQPTDDTHLRHEQIALRCAEIEEVVKVMRRFSEGEDIQRHSFGPSRFDWSRLTHLDATRPIMAGHSLGGSVGLASSAAKEIDWRAIIVFDPATQRLEPWCKTVPHPLLVINSEEYTVGREYAIFAEQIAGTTKQDVPPLVFSIPGATHPSFSDVFLILPEYVNKLTGLRADAGRVISLVVGATADFLDGRADAIVKRSSKYKGDPKSGKLVVAGDTDEEDGEKVVPKPKRPVGTPGKLIWHEF